jgi:hypothetical protein
VDAMKEEKERIIIFIFVVVRKKDELRIVQQQREM